MNKKCIIGLLLFLAMVLSLVPVFAEQAPDQIADTIHKVMQIAKKDIAEDVNHNIDENFAQLDERMSKNNENRFRKAVFGLIGGLGVIIFGYAYWVGSLLKKYDVAFYEKLIEHKLSLMKDRTNILSPSGFYDSVTASSLDKSFVNPEKYFDSFYGDKPSPLVEPPKKEVESKSVPKPNLDFYSSLKAKEELDKVNKFEDSKKQRNESFFAKYKVWIIIAIILIILLILAYIFITKSVPVSTGIGV